MEANASFQACTPVSAYRVRKNALTCEYPSIIRSEVSMTIRTKRGDGASDPGWSNCVFCGKTVPKAARSRERILPMWLLRATGDPNRRIKIETDPITGDDIFRPASTFHFPACSPCNALYGKTLETRAKNAVEALVAGKSPEVSQCYWLLDWLDKVRIGLWLGFNMLHKEEFQPSIY